MKRKQQLHAFDFKKSFKKITFLFVLISGLLFSTALFAQTNVSGRITGANGSPLAGVSVIIKGTKNGTSTDNAGNFTIQVPAGARLLISYVGYASQDIAVNNRTQINAVLQDATPNTVEDVVVKRFNWLNCKNCW
jgi:TonB-dependent starch-binding outer membrane protein SusC